MEQIVSRKMKVETYKEKSEEEKRIDKRENKFLIFNFIQRTQVKKKEVIINELRKNYESIIY